MGTGGKSCCVDKTTQSVAQLDGKGPEGGEEKTPVLHGSQDKKTLYSFFYHLYVYIISLE